MRSSELGRGDPATSVYVGIDVHPKQSQVAVVTEDGTVELNSRWTNWTSGGAALARWRRWPPTGRRLDHARYMSPVMQRLEIAQVRAVWLWVCKLLASPALARTRHLPRPRYSL